MNDAPVTRPDLDVLAAQLENIARRGDSYSEDGGFLIDDEDAATCREAIAALAAERARADQAASKAVHEYALALEQNRSAENWRWSDFVWDAHQWADSKSSAPTAEQ
jgi:hypothetical protein